MTDSILPNSSHSAHRLPAEVILWEARASKVLQYISRKSSYMLNQRNRSIEILLSGSTKELYSPDKQECAITWRTIERFAGQWQLAVSTAPEIKAALAHMIAAQYTLVKGEMPHLWQALGLDEKAVQEAHQTLYAQPLESLFVPAPPPDSPCESAAPIDWVSAEDLQILQDSIEHVHLSSGDTLFKEGDEGDSMYVISSGRMQVIAQGEDQRPRVVAERGRDELVGEMALLTGVPRTATLRAMRDTELYRLPQKTFEKIVAHYPYIALHMTRTLALRLADSARHERLARPVTSVSIFPAGAQADTAEFSLALANALRKFGSVLHLNSSLVNQKLEPGAAQASPNTFEDTRLNGWLNDCEEQHHFVVYEADKTLTEWTRRCIRQGDRLLLVGQAKGSPQLNGIEEAIFRGENCSSQAHRELVLLHENAENQPSGTRAWLDLRPVEDHHHIVASSEAHMARMARLLLGKPFCLVLSGGSVRGFTHIGALRALREAGIDVDIIGGASAGSIVAALFAQGVDDTEMVRISKTIMKDSSKLFSDYTWPVASVNSAKRLNAIFKSLFGESLIEDLWIKYFCTTVDLTDARLLVHRQGPLRHFVRASTSMPVVFPPVVHNRHLLVDGGLMNNLPVEQMLEIAPGGTLMAVNVGPDFYTAQEAFNYGDDLPFWMVFNARLNPFAKKLVLPAIGNVLMRCIEVGSKSFEAPQIAKTDIYVLPPLGNASLFKADNVEELIEIGYQATREKLAEWQGR
ncbi:MAG TPA: cyclic nucleotide-binding and patatin-like phospholipase domain-containing protein [Anaerolineaceae bacterium]|nr:cyclic nucleotide-binding and patatin-like phospholipase domain-containing protein [Anaerolineaceae bacterium]